MPFLSLSDGLVEVSLGTDYKTYIEEVLLAALMLSFFQKKIRRSRKKPSKFWVFIVSRNLGSECVECIRWFFSPNTINLKLVLAGRRSSRAALLPLAAVCSLPRADPGVCVAMWWTVLGNWAGFKLTWQRNVFVIAWGRRPEQAARLRRGRAASFGSAASLKQDLWSCSLGCLSFEGVWVLGWLLWVLHYRSSYRKLWERFLQPVVMLYMLVGCFK